MRRYPELDVSTCHNYEISFAFRWQCTNPGCASRSLAVLRPRMFSALSCRYESALTT